MNVTPHLLKWLAKRMAEKEWSQSDLATEIGVTHSTISRIMHQRVDNIGPKTVTAITERFNLTQIELYNISQGLPPSGVNGGKGPHNTNPDAIAQLSQFLRTLPQAKQEPFFLLAQGMGMPTPLSPKKTNATAEDSTPSLTSPNS